MTVKYDIERIKSIIDDICGITDMSICLSDTKYNEIYSHETQNDTFCHMITNTKVGELKCSHSDRSMLERCTRGSGLFPMSAMPACWTPWCRSSKTALWRGI